MKLSAGNRLVLGVVIQDDGKYARYKEWNNASFEVT